jgi:hypothetical protein
VNPGAGGDDGRVVTIGVYGFDDGSFLDRLRRADVRLLLDVRQRRGVRGPEYAWANSLRLQAALARAGIGYAHHLELAPTTELRRLQYAEDDRRGVGKRSRRELAAEYVRRYTAEVLDRADLAPIVAALPRGGAAARSASGGRPSGTGSRSSTCSRRDRGPRPPGAGAAATRWAP